MKPFPRIAIIGAGPGGLMLARILHTNGIAATVFELDQDALIRPQGGSLDLERQFGQLALERAGLLAEFKLLARYEDQGMRIFDKAGNLLFEDNEAASDDRPEIDRSQLRNLLLASVPSERIHWNNKLREVLPRDNGTYDLIFDRATAGPFDLVVGADGTWSRIRPLVSSYSPQYTGVTFIELGIDDVDARYPGVAYLVGHGTISILGDSQGLFIQRNANSHVRVYATFRVPKDWAAANFDFSSPASVRANLASHFEGWSPELLGLIHASNDQIRPHRIYALPVGHHWPNRIGITLLGDAAHVMSPYGGGGVNHAMFDAAELARLLVESNDWISAINAYEADMFERVRSHAVFAAEGVATVFSYEHIKHAVDFQERKRLLRERNTLPA